MKDLFKNFFSLDGHDTDWDAPSVKADKKLIEKKYPDIMAKDHRIATMTVLADLIRRVEDIEEIAIETEQTREKSRLTGDKSTFVREVSDVQEKVVDRVDAIQRKLPPWEVITANGTEPVPGSGIWEYSDSSWPTSQFCNINGRVIQVLAQGPIN